MKAVLMSIKKQWIEKILDGEKTIEVRKTKPNLEVPFKVYIYCTKDNQNYDLYINEKSAREEYGNFSRLRAGQDEVVETVSGFNTFIAHGKVIGEFVCDKVENIFSRSRFWLNEDTLKFSCLSAEQIWDYANGAEKIYGWRITDLKIYDKPKELTEFIRICPEWEKEKITDKCYSCNHYFKNYEECFFGCDIEGELLVTISPQSWCYIEENNL